MRAGADAFFSPFTASALKILLLTEGNGVVRPANRRRRLFLVLDPKNLWATIEVGAPASDAGGSPRSFDLKNFMGDG